MEAGDTRLHCVALRLESCGTFVRRGADAPADRGNAVHSAGNVFLLALLNTAGLDFCSLECAGLPLLSRPRAIIPAPAREQNLYTDCWSSPSMVDCYLPDYAADSTTSVCSLLARLGNSGFSSTNEN